MTNTIRTTFDNINKASTDEEKVEALKNGLSNGMINLLRGAFNSDVTYNLSIPEYTRRDPKDPGVQPLEEAALLLQFFNTSSSLSVEDKTNLLKNTLETMNNADDDLFLAVIAKNVPNLTKEIVDQAFPGLLH